MIAADMPVQRRSDAKLLVVGPDAIRHVPRAEMADLLRRGDLVIANDAATLPASLHGVHGPTGGAIEVRLAAWSGPAGLDVSAFQALVLGPGDFRTRTEDRPMPPSLSPGDRLLLGPLEATVAALLDHPRLVMLRFDAPPEQVWAGLARHGRPIQYAHVPAPLVMWDVWTPIASLPIAFEPPSASFALDWAAVETMRQRGVAFATLTHAAGISSTGDPALDARLPFDEPYVIPAATAAAIRRTRDGGGRIVAVGTTVVRALEHAAAPSGIVRGGAGVADNRIGPSTRIRVCDAILSGTHEPDGSHYQVLRAFAADDLLEAASRALDAAGYRTHEFGDSVFIERSRRESRASSPRGRELPVAV